MVAERVFQPTWASAPGDTINDAIASQNMTLSSFASHMHCSEEKIVRLIEGKSRITNVLASRLENTVGGSVAFWMARESQYRASLKRLMDKNDPIVLREWLRELPLRDMVKFGWVQQISNDLKQAQACLEFFKVQNVLAWDKKYRGIDTEVAFRKTEAFESRPGAVITWLRQGELESESVACKVWSASKFEAALLRIRMLTRYKDPNVFLPKLIRLCAECGVAVAIVPSPTGCRASGATRFISSTKALLMLSFRYRTDDHFWFTFFHEAAHLLLHSKSSVFVEGNHFLLTHEEEEANDFSARILIPKEYAEELLNLKRKSREIIRFSIKAGIAPGIVVGQLQHLGRIGHNQFNHLKRRYQWA